MLGYILLLNSNSERSSVADRAPNPPGTVAVLYASDSAHYSQFTINLDKLSIPAGTEKDFEPGIDRVDSMNLLVDRALGRGFYWIWFIDEDRSFAPDILEQLLARNEAIIAPITISTEPPFQPESLILSDRGEIKPLVLDDYTGPGSLLEVASVGASGMLIRRAVLESMEPPWFRRGTDGTETLWFCTKARELGFQPYIDTSARIGNFQIASLVPNHKGGKWEIGIKISNEFAVSFPLKNR